MPDRPGQPSPAKRRRLTADRRAATEELTAEEAERRRVDANERLRTVWDDIIARYGAQPADEDASDEDVIDWDLFEVVEDRGAVRNGPARPLGAFASASGQRPDTPSDSEASEDDEEGLQTVQTTLVPDVVDLCSSSSEGEAGPSSPVMRARRPVKPPPASPEPHADLVPNRPLTRSRSVATGTLPIPVWPYLPKPRRSSPAAADDESEDELALDLVRPAKRTVSRRAVAASPLSDVEDSDEADDEAASPLAERESTRGHRMSLAPSPSPPIRARSPSTELSDIDDFLGRLSPFSARPTSTPPSSARSETPASPFIMPALPVKRPPLPLETPVKQTRARTAAAAAALAASGTPIAPSLQLIRHAFPSASPAPSLLRSAMKKPGAGPRLTVAPSPTPSSVRFRSPPPSSRLIHVVPASPTPSSVGWDSSAAYEVSSSSPTSPRERSVSPTKRLPPRKGDKGEVFFEWPRSVSVETVDRAQSSVPPTEDDFENILPSTPVPLRSIRLPSIQPYRRRASTAFVGRTGAASRTPSVTPFVRAPTEVATESGKLVVRTAATPTPTPRKTRSSVPPARTPPTTRAASARSTPGPTPVRLPVLRSRSVRPSPFKGRASTVAL